MYQCITLASMHVSMAAASSETCQRRQRLTEGSLG